MADHKFSPGSRNANLIRVILLFGPMMIALGLLAFFFATAHAHDRHGAAVVPATDKRKQSQQVSQPDFVTIDFSGGPVA